jgi:digeranylgeranylglycerophospholipid reductase
LQLKSTNPHHTVIIGASTAGLYTAWLLAKGGAPVVLLDQAERPGPPARTLIATARLRDVLDFVPEESVVNHVPDVQMFSPRASVAIRLREPDLIVERATLVRLLMSHAEAAGVQFMPGHRFLGLEPDHDGVYVHAESSTGRQVQLRTRVLIGADGALSSVAKAVGLGVGATVFNLQATVNMPRAADAGVTQVWFEPELTRYFFWLIPESRERAVAGLIAGDKHQAYGSLTTFLAAHGLEPLGYQEAPVPLYNRSRVSWRNLSGARVMLVGDAAAQVKVTTVGGLVTGLRGAQAAARAVLQGTGYRRQLSALRRELDSHLWIRTVLNRFGPGEYDELLRLVSARTIKVLTSLTRDEAGRVLLLSLLSQPAFAGLAARCLLGTNAASRQRALARSVPRGL